MGPGGREEVTSCCPNCRWSLAFKARPAEVVGYEWHEASWVAYCWNPSCERREVESDEAFVRGGDS